MNQPHRIVAVTPAGRAHYLEILKSYILRDESIVEWQLWDNCRKPSDRAYIEELARRHPKIRIVRAPRIDGSNRAINQFYRGLTDRDAFYIKMDDDLVYLPPQFGGQLYRAAQGDAGRYLYWSPLVVNNAICSWLIKHHSRMNVAAGVIAAADCITGWRNPYFAEALHRSFIAAHDTDALDLFSVPDFNISLARFSINCIGFFGSEVADLGHEFCPLEVDDEEWLSAILPSRIGKPGRIIGRLLISHFSFFTQERELLQSGVLDEYFRIAGVAPIAYPTRFGWRTALRREFVLKVLKRFPRCAPITARELRPSVAAAPGRARSNQVPALEAQTPT